MSVIDEMIPPEAMNFVGGGNFKEIGDEFLRLFVELGGLQPHHRVLDVGCGIGRMAIPLTQYLSEKGRYEGFDVVTHGIEWCQARISTRYPHFRFQLANVVNQLYNQKGKRSASRYKFKYWRRSFDFVFLTSVFTHMLQDELENYLSEVKRVLVTGGTSFITMFLLNEESEGLLKAGRGNIQFPHPVGQCRVQRMDVQEHAVAYPEQFVRDLYAKYGLEIQEPIHYGNWCGREQHTSYQDIIIATKR
jgi:ubiquinone/menaquinone biosynthesis C-methylase UbiE